MKLSDLIDDVRADAPPARYDVDDAVRAGKSLRRRRRAGVVIAAVTAVAVAVGVPQIASRPAEKAPTPVAPATPLPQYTFRGYDMRGLHVDSPNRWNLREQSSGVWVDGDLAAVLTVLHPGVEVRDPGTAPHIPTADINGRPAYFFQALDGAHLAFEYADDAWAEIQPMSRAGTTERVRAVAEGFRLTTPYPVTVAFRTENIPAGSQIAEISVPDPKLLGSQIALLPVTHIQAILNNPTRDLPVMPVTHPPNDEYWIDLVTVQSFAGRVYSGPERGREGCARKSSDKDRYSMCEVEVGQGRWTLSVIGPTGAEEEAARLLTATTNVPDPANQGNWLTPDRAFPASALVVPR
jgi:hypothetical protein